MEGAPRVTEILIPRSWSGGRAELARTDGSPQCYWCGALLQPCSRGDGCPGTTSTATTICAHCFLHSACPHHGRNWYAC